ALEGDKGPAPETARADPDARQRRPELPGGRRPRRTVSVGGTCGRARPRLQARPRSQPGDASRGTAGAPETGIRLDRGADPRPAHLVDPGFGLTQGAAPTPEATMGAPQARDCSTAMLKSPDPTVPQSRSQRARYISVPRADEMPPRSRIRAGGQPKLSSSSVT